MGSVEDLVGTEVQGWMLTRRIGRGADGIVYAGTKGDREAAIKIFFPDSLVANGIAAARERLELQIGLIGEKRHPNLVQVHDGGEEPDLETLFLVMELVDGTSLDKLLGKIPAEAIPKLAGQLASAAEYLESVGLVHRDIKPANIMISDDFQTLTLLDLGIVHQLPADDDQGRLSGLEFVATLRYSPPEFVWRTEETSEDGAWRAVTFYQIGATLHDMITGSILFSGYDTPRACLYDSVRDRTPVIKSNVVDASLIQVTQACLLKDWRQRLQFVSWGSFYGSVSAADPQQQEKRIRLRQLMQEEERQASAKRGAKALGPTREQQLWQLNNTLMLEIRTYLLDTSIFPMCRVEENMISPREYAMQLHFDNDQSRGFQSNVSFTVTIGVDSMMEDATKLSFSAVKNGQTVASAAWTEMFTVETAFASCRQAFLNAVEAILSA
ncbi:serine/threonine-protein kinase [Burkholderia sp. Ac-20392]|uniref:protein kinase domain-containing protein n=1 Tax=Burkholderia sp. Ac-20392 TaxID=2703905 RepID=UPI00197E2D62|nr:serine/threonine protein kinase [Burkholderia sp. Ac-20392]